MTGKKSIHNACPVCGLPRGKGKYEFAHGKCIEIRAKQEANKMSGKFINKKTKPLSVAAVENSARNAAKKNYLKGKLPKWMYS